MCMILRVLSSVEQLLMLAVRLDSSVEDKLFCLAKETGRNKSYYTGEVPILDYPEYQIALLENPRGRGGF